jgi:Holliday junction resolvasome RuvABC ATP-dependent DNA helicase subunit
MNYLPDDVTILDYFSKTKSDFVDENDSVLNVVIKTEALDLSHVEEGTGSNQYRPTCLNDYYGQERAKKRLMDYIEGCKETGEPMPHIFLSAPPGHGKSLLSMIIAKMLDKKIVQCVGGDLKTEQIFIDKINECNGGVIFIDEANMIKKRVGFFMLPIIEQFIVNGIKLKPFTLILATTHRGELSKDLDALIQRCELDIELEHYNESDLIKITQQFKDKQYRDYDVPNNIYECIAKNCKQTPRLARRLLRNYIFTKDFDRVLKQNKIVKDGLTETDFEVLQYLHDFPNGASRNTIANHLRMKPQTYQYDIEPYLMFKNLIKIENKTKLTEQGKQLLEVTP